MKRAIALVPLFVLAAAVGVWRFHPPYSLEIERRVAQVGCADLLEAYDFWRADQDDKGGAIDIAKLPPRLRALRPVEARLRPEGLYLVLRRRSAEEDGVLMVAPNVVFQGGRDSNPSWVSLGFRVVRYHVSG